MSIPAFAWAIEQGRALGLPPADRLVLIYLADKANGVRVCWPGQETIRAFTGLALNTVAAAIRRLAERKLIELEASPGRATRYHILRDETPADGEGVNEVIHSPRKSARGAPANGGGVVIHNPPKREGEPPQMRGQTPANERDEPYLTKKENLERGARAPEAQSQDLDSGGKEASEGKQAARDAEPSPPPAAPPAPNYDPTFTTTDKPRATAEGVHRAVLAALADLGAPYRPQADRVTLPPMPRLPEQDRISRPAPEPEAEPVPEHQRREAVAIRKQLGRTLGQKAYAPGRRPVRSIHEQIAADETPPLDAPLPPIPARVLDAVLAARQELAARAAQRQMVAA